MEGLQQAVRLATLEPEWFSDTILRCPNDPWQTELYEAVADVWRKQMGIQTRVNHEGLNKISIRAGHGPGKTHGLAKVAHLVNFTHRARIVATAPKEQQLLTRLWPEFRKITGGALSEYQRLIHIETRKITWAQDPDWVMLAETASQPENLAGHHCDFLVFMVDEAAGVSESMFPVIEGALTTHGVPVTSGGGGVGFCVLIMISNPTKNEGSFWASHRKRNVRDEYYRIHVSLDKTTRVSKKWVQGLVRKYGANSPVVLVRAHGEFADSSENQLMPAEWMYQAKDRVRKPDGSLPRTRISCDVADGGTAETIVKVTRFYDSFTRWMKVGRYSFPASESPVLTAQEIVRVWADFKMSAKKGDDIVIDALGVGSGAAGILIKAKYPVIPYKGGKRSDKPDRWRNKRTQSYLCLRDEFRDGKIVIDDGCFQTEEDWDDMVGQLCLIKRREGAERLEDLEPKKSITDRGDPSPDMADASAMDYATDEPQIDTGFMMPVIVGEALTSNYESLTADLADHESIH